MTGTLLLMLFSSSIANKDSVIGSSLSTPAIESLHLSLGDVRERRGDGGGRKVVFLEVHAYYHDVSDANVRMHQQNVPLYVLATQLVHCSARAPHGH